MAQSNKVRSVTVNGRTKMYHADDVDNAWIKGNSVDVTEVV